jgi:hypothetical protein
MSLPLGHRTVTCIRVHNSLAKPATLLSRAGHFDVVVVLQRVSEAHYRFSRRCGVGAARQRVLVVGHAVCSQSKLKGNSGKIYLPGQGLKGIKFTRQTIPAQKQSSHKRNHKIRDHMTATPLTRQQLPELPGVGQTVVNIVQHHVSRDRLRSRFDVRKAGSDLTQT